MGRNGAGKSTLMNILTGYLASSEGQAFIGGHDVQLDPLAARALVLDASQLRFDSPMAALLEGENALRVVFSGGENVADALRALSGVTRVRVLTDETNTLEVFGEPEKDLRLAVIRCVSECGGVLLELSPPARRAGKRLPAPAGRRKGNCSVKAIFHHELRSYFTTPMGYVFLIMYTLLAGMVAVFVNIGQEMSASTNLFLSGMQLPFMLIAPILTMRVFAEERRAKTDQLLLTAPVRIVSVVLGKALACFTMLLLAMGLTVLFPVVISRYAQVSAPQIAVVYLGYFLHGADALPNLPGHRGPPTCEGVKDMKRKQLPFSLYNAALCLLVAVIFVLGILCIQVL